MYQNTGVNICRSPRIDYSSKSFIPESDFCAYLCQRLPRLHRDTLMLPLNSSSLCMSHALSRCNVGIPAVRPNNKGCAPCLPCHYIINMPLYGALHCRSSGEGGVLARLCNCLVCTCVCACLKPSKGSGEVFFFLSLDVCNV